TEFQQKFGEKAVKDKLYQTVLGAANNYLTVSEKGEASLNEQGFINYLEKVKSWNLPKEKQLIQYAKINVYERSKQWEKFAEAVDNGLKMDIVLSPMMLWNYAMFTEANCDNETILLKAAHWSEVAAKK